MKLPDTILPDSAVWGFDAGFDDAAIVRGTPREGERYVDGEPGPHAGTGGEPLADIVRAACSEHGDRQAFIWAKFIGETSFLSAQTPPGKGYKAPLGFDCPDGGRDPRLEYFGVARNIRGAIAWWGKARTVTDFPRPRRVNVSAEGTRAVYESVDPRTRAEGAYFRYTPHVYSLHHFLAILQRRWPELLEATPMRGFMSVHPSTEDRLRACGVTDDMVTQGVGSARASAGTHLSVGEAGGRRFGHCIDLSFRYTPNRSHFDRLVVRGFAPFLRFWAGNEHWHIIDAVGLSCDDGSHPDHLPKVNAQLRDWTHGRNGLVDGAPLPTAWAPTQEQRELIRSVWIAHTDWGASGDDPDEWAREAWEWCQANGLLDGTRPRGQITRQELAAVTHRLRFLIRKADHHSHEGAAPPPAA